MRQPLKITIIIIFGILVPGCATTPPSWTITGHDPAYPDSAWVTGVGSGRTPNEARQSALGFLVLRIQETVSVSDEDTIRRTNLKETHSVRSEILISSTLVLHNVRYPQLVKYRRHWYALAALNRKAALSEATKKLDEDLMKRSAAISSIKGKPIFRKMAVLKGALAIDRTIERDREMVAVFGGNPSGIGPYYRDKRILENLEDRYSTFYARIEGSGSLGDTLIQGLTESGFQQTPDLAKASFILQGGIRSTFVVPPSDSPYFWIGYSLALSFSDIRSGNTLVERTDSGISPGLSRSQATINMEKFVLRQDINPFIEDIEKKLSFEK